MSLLNCITLLLILCKLSFPDILLDIADTYKERDVASFTCQAIGEPAPNISWYFNGTMINESDTSKYRIEPRPINIPTEKYRCFKCDGNNYVLIKYCTI